MAVETTVTPTGGSMIRRIRLGSQLRTFREARESSQDGDSYIIPGPRSKISRIELSRVGVQKRRPIGGRDVAGARLEHLTDTSELKPSHNGCSPPARVGLPLRRHRLQCCASTKPIFRTLCTKQPTSALCPPHRRDNADQYHSVMGRVSAESDPRIEQPMNSA